MDLSRRGVLGGLGAVCAVCAVGAVGAVSFAGADGSGSTDDDAGGSGDDDESGTVAVDPDAPFVARLIDDSDGSDDGGDSDDGDDGSNDSDDGSDGSDDEDETRLFDASDLAEAEGVSEEGDEHLVYVALGDEGIEAFQNRLEESGATDEPTAFVVSMSLDGTEIRRVDLDRETVDALTDAEWSGVLTLPFEEERIARSVYDGLADD